MASLRDEPGGISGIDGIGNDEFSIGTVIQLPRDFVVGQVVTVSNER
jgi:hypothetical protein